MMVSYRTESAVVVIRMTFAIPSRISILWSIPARLAHIRQAVHSRSEFVTLEACLEKFIGLLQLKVPLLTLIKV